MVTFSSTLEVQKTINVFSRSSSDSSISRPFVTNNVVVYNFNGNNTSWLIYVYGNGTIDKLMLPVMGVTAIYGDSNNAIYFTSYSR